MFKSVYLCVSALLVLVACAERETKSSNSAAHSLAQAKGAILRAEGPVALNALSQVTEDELSPHDKAFHSCATQRLDGSNMAPTQELTSGLAQEILSIYRTYWTDAIMDNDGRDDAEQNLARQLTNLLQIEDPDAIETTITERLQSDGLYVLMGRTGKLRELMIWTSQIEEQETVQLPEGEVSTRVFYLNNFVSAGWSNYFSCDTLGTGGWAKSDGLYVVVPGWKSLNDERFRVSLLAHESQHFQDYSRFPDLAGWELEYRAKLVELALADSGQDQLIRHFTGNQGEDDSDAHSYANRKVLADLRTHLGLEPSDRLKFDSKLVIQQAAEALLKRDSQQRLQQRAGE